MVPAELRSRPQWVVWRSKSGKNGKQTKVPFQSADPSVPAESDNPATWGTYEQARAVPDVDGIGYVFSPDDPYTGVDLDDCIDSGTGEVHPAAADIVARLASYAERSPSGAGVHIIIKAELHSSRYKTADTPWQGVFEVYDRLRYFTVTGQGGGEIASRQEQLDAVVAERLPARPKPKPRANGRVTVSLSDGQLLDKAFAAKNGAKVRALYHSPVGDDEDWSAGDQSLCNSLAFWTGGDTARMDSLFRSSARMREKWDERRGATTYGQMTIETAISDCAEFYNPHHNSSAARPRAETAWPSGSARPTATPTTRS